MTPTLYIFSGLPGTGKSTLAVALARSQSAAYLRLDTIEQAIKNSTQLNVGPEGYEVAYALALDNLRNGLDVVADSVNSLEITRKAWHETALAANSSFVDIEVVCSDAKEHRRRVEGRKSAWFIFRRFQVTLAAQNKPSSAIVYLAAFGSAYAL